MFTLKLLYRKAGPLGRFVMLAFFLSVFVITIVRVHKAVQANQERNSHVHTRRNSR
jgi:hypothetical protein